MRWRGGGTTRAHGDYGGAVSTGVRRVLVAAGAVVAVALVVILATGVLGDRAAGDDDERRDRTALLAYDDAFESPSYDAGRVVVQGLQAGLADLAQDLEEPETVARRANGNVRELRLIRDRMSDVDAPEFLQGAQTRRLRAMETYILAARTLADAADAEGDERERLLDEVVSLGKRGDRIWEDADAVVDRYRRRLGLPVEEPLDTQE